MKTNEVIKNWFDINFKPVKSKCVFWQHEVMCYPILQENTFLKTNDSIKLKIDGVTFRYKSYQDCPMPQTRSYQVIYKILKH